MTILRIDHIAIVVPEVEHALSFWQDSLGLSLEHLEEVKEQQTIAAMLPVGEVDIELVQPTSEESGMARYMEKRGAGLHHVCFEVDDIEATLAELNEKGIRLINEKPVIGAGGRRVAFVHPKASSGVLLELVEAKTL